MVGTLGRGDGGCTSDLLMMWEDRGTGDLSVIL